MAQQDEPADNPNNPDIPPEGHESKSGRPGGPGQSGMNPVGAGHVTPGPDQEAPEPDDATVARRERLRRQNDDPSGGGE
ncbi:hypothetical protein [Euzebya tangerina]|uniref:hypothetical protein n=1 Tax=Euzebya tangerina TaxID=591198 RepID=UPI000E321EF6|nr:hypothetical protein [Euzebya tangerina]